MPNNSTLYFVVLFDVVFLSLISARLSATIRWIFLYIVFFLSLVEHVTYVNSVPFGNSVWLVKHLSFVDLRRERKNAQKVSKHIGCATYEWRKHEHSFFQIMGYFDKTRFQMPRSWNSLPSPPRKASFEVGHVIINITNLPKIGRQKKNYRHSLESIIVVLFAIFLIMSSRNNLIAAG